MRGETTLQMATRHVREGEVHIACQQDIIDHLRREGLPTFQAESLLEIFLLVQAAHQDHLQSLQEEAMNPPRAFGGS